MNNSGKRNYSGFWGIIAQILHPHRSSDYGDDGEVFQNDNENDRFRNSEDSKENWVRVRRKKRKYMTVYYY
ncbi:MAG: hypothetical protein H8E11_06640 [Candidatus Cloacimonetes bacterium]|nr:hypothetical protein [Candidatus Cloacimonadota bacterium]